MPCSWGTSLGVGLKDDLKTPLLFCDEPDLLKEKLQAHLLYRHLYGDAFGRIQPPRQRSCLCKRIIVPLVEG